MCTMKGEKTFSRSCCTCLKTRVSRMSRTSRRSLDLGRASSSCLFVLSFGCGIRRASEGGHSRHPRKTQEGGLPGRAGQGPQEAVPELEMRLGGPQRAELTRAEAEPGAAPCAPPLQVYAKRHTTLHYGDVRSKPLRCLPLTLNTRGLYGLSLVTSSVSLRTVLSSGECPNQRHHVLHHCPASSRSRHTCAPADSCFKQQRPFVFDITSPGT